MQNLEIKFSNPQQRDFYYADQRNQLFSGGFNNGKSFIGSLKAFTLLSTFPGYRFAINRQVRSDLMKTTYQTFFKICPQEFIESQNLQEGVTHFKNKSLVFWLHLDKVDENTLRGLEVNSVLTDQAEEMTEKVYDVLDARIGRWDNVEIPAALLTSDWPTNPFSGKYIAPSYHLNLCNPDTTFHFLYRHYHPDSLERKPNHFYIEGEWDEKLGSSETYQNALRRGEEYVNRYVRGQWGISNAQIHHVDPSSILEYSDELLDRIRRKGNLYRILDHGDAAPTCCLWAAVLDGNFIFFREYYVPNQVISEHRKAINDLSENESYSGNYADPSIFRKSSQKDGAFWTVADEYITSEVNGKPLHWLPADNNEYATRNRINELLKPSELGMHPISGLSPAPKIYFVKRSNKWPFGCYHAITQLGSQRRKILAYLEGTTVYGDDREDSVADHSYDCIRYFVAAHGSPRVSEAKRIPRNSIAYYKMIAKKKTKSLFASD